jgi:hypothetical protein
MFPECRRQWGKDMYEANVKLPALSDELSNVPDDTKRHFGVVKDEKNP